MKTLGTLTLIALTAMAAMPSAQAATIKIDNFDIDPGGNAVVAVAITPDAEGMIDYKGFQFDMSSLPLGVAVDFGATTAQSGFIFKGETYSDRSSRFMSYSDNAVKNTASILKITFSASENAAEGTYTIKISDVVFSSPLGEDIIGQGSTFNITVNPSEPPYVPETPEIPDTPLPEGMYGNANGTYISAVKIREGNLLTMGIISPEGGYDDSWEYIWSNDNATPIGVERQITVPAELWGTAANAGKNQAISKNVYTVNVSNYDPEDNVFWNQTFPTAEVDVYKRPQIPTQLLRKGDGSSCTFVVMMTPLGNEEILALGLSYTYGYTDKNGVRHTLATTPLRYTHTTKEIYNNRDYTFWAYSQWTYSDGSVITSGLRYLDGSEDPDFDASIITGASRSGNSDASGIAGVAEEAIVLGIYTFDGRFAGTDVRSLAPGMYIIKTDKGVVKTLKK